MGLFNYLSHKLLILIIKLDSKAADSNPALAIKIIKTLAMRGCLLPIGFVKPAIIEPPRAEVGNVTS
jgi:hypothetical protein